MENLHLQRAGRNARMTGRPGWNPNDPHQCALVISNKTTRVATMAEECTSCPVKHIASCLTREGQEALGKLFVAAPDLLEVCELVLKNGVRHETSSVFDDGDRIITNKIKAAIAKAKG